MNPRRFIVLALGAGLAGRGLPSRAHASNGRIRCVGVLAPSTRANEEVTLKPFFDQMRQLGWVEGQNIAYDWACADNQQESLPRLAAEMVARHPEVIYAPPTPSALAAKRATQTIPIVFGAVADPVGIGLTASLAHPGGNVTGMSVSVAGTLAPKRFELLREILPGAARFGMIGDSTDPVVKIDQQAVASVAAAQGITIIVAEASNPSTSRTFWRHIAFPESRHSGRSRMVAE